MFCCCAFTIPQKKTAGIQAVKFGIFQVKFCRSLRKNVKNRRIFVKFGMRRKLWLWYDKRNLKRGASVKDIKAAGGDIMLRIALCDDEQEARDQLRFQLEKSLYETDEEIVYEFSSGETAVRWLKKHPGEIDLLFLDVEMKEMTGMEAAERIREFDKTILLVFVTGYSEYVFDGYRTGALDYVMKPAGEERIRQIVSRAREAFYSRREKDFVFQNQEGTFRIALDQILYFYSDRRQVYLVTENREYAFYGKLSEVQSQVDARFVRIHQRYLVNGDHVEYIGHDEILTGGKNLPVSRGMKEEALKRLAELMLKGAGL